MTTYSLQLKARNCKRQRFVMPRKTSILIPWPRHYLTTTLSPSVTWNLPFHCPLLDKCSFHSTMTISILFLVRLRTLTLPIWWRIISRECLLTNSSTWNKQVTRFLQFSLDLLNQTKSKRQSSSWIQVSLNKSEAAFNQHRPVPPNLSICSNLLIT